MTDERILSTNASLFLARYRANRLDASVTMRNIHNNIKTQAMLPPLTAAEVERGANSVSKLHIPMDQIVFDMDRQTLSSPS